MQRSALILAFWLATAPVALAADPVDGDWSIGHAIIRIAPCARAPSELCGLITSAPPGRDGKPQRDTANPDPALRSRPVVGLALLYGFHRDAPGRWVGGKIYDPDSGKTFDSTLTLQPSGALSVAGCVLVFCKAQTWRRIG
jgi:uncharacterized protein (DUF2147 family)